MTTGPFSGLAATDYADRLKRLLPPGPAFPSALDALVQAAALQGLADTYFGLHARSVTLLDVESDPALTDELLTDWETEYGLPDPCTPLNPIYGQRIAALLAKIASQGGQSDDYLIGVAAAMGFTITITHLRASKFGLAPYGATYGSPLDGPVCDYVMEINVSNGAQLTWSQFGTASYGDPIDAVSSAELECRLRAIAPADDYLLFNYPS